MREKGVGTNTEGEFSTAPEKKKKKESEGGGGGILGKGNIASLGC